MFPDPSDTDAPDSTVVVDGLRVGVPRFGAVGGCPRVWCHGGLNSALEAKFLDAAGLRFGADIVSLDRPGIGRSEPMQMTSIGQWGHWVEQIADVLELDDFAVAGWSAGGLCVGGCSGDATTRARRGHLGGHGSTRERAPCARVGVAAVGRIVSVIERQ